jgi:hypothetical protein
VRASAAQTDLLHAWMAGDQDALNRVVEFLYPKLKQIAHAHLSREGPGHILQTTCPRQRVVPAACKAEEHVVQPPGSLLCHVGESDAYSCKVRTGNEVSRLHSTRRRRNPPRPSGRRETG